MAVDLMIEDARWRDAGLQALADAASRTALTHLRLDPEHFEISLLACNDSRIAALNADFRGKPAPTNVLSWPSEERGARTPGASPRPPAPQEAELGDIAIAYDTCRNEAAAADKPFDQHVTHLIVHATLHLLGYDHERDEDATLMERLESAILAEMGLSDPYEEQNA
ncbi:rRNA maturation RNase YbeY [Pseudooceanicola sp.]|uniref:rRNA maturation RNase YbeY n=1 Tax=Pseudooceanicola sp. TaxID=1914328 RepID=UPI0026047F7F|nr:rRNA maturation RNase YbeY [Pseudooceanicola sp.]MDF1855993.1 rRNA maturation RNase YbeY [Pseudooceanicola sp.]